MPDIRRSPLKVESATRHHLYRCRKLLKGFLDLDTVCQGDGEIDVGNFCAHLVLRALQAGSSTEAAERLGEMLVASYRTARPAADPRRVAWYRASALLRLACVYALRPWWHGLAPALIDESRRALEA